MARRPLPFDPVTEARRHWDERYQGGSEMAAATSLVRAAEIVNARTEEALRPFNLNFPRYEALVLLDFTREGALPLGKMGERLMIHPANITGIIDRLEAQGLVERRPHPTDRRTVLAAITDSGRRLVETATAAVVEATFGLDGLSERQLDSLTRLTATVRHRAGDFSD